MRQVALLLELAEPTVRAIAQLRGWYRRLSEQAARLPVPTHGYLVVTPLGLAQTETIQRALASHGFGPPLFARTLPWPRASTALRLWSDDRPMLRRALLYEQAWTGLFDGLGEAWAFPAAELARLTRQKATLRAELVEPSCAIATGRLQAVLHALHVPDVSKGGAEAIRLDALLDGAERIAR